MSKVALIQVVYNSMKFIPQVFTAVYNQTYKDFEFYVVVSGNDDGSKEYIQEHFPQVKIIDPGYNIGFSKGHNELFQKIDVEFFQLVNPDLIMTPTYLEEMLKALEQNARAGAVTGKLLRYDFEKNQETNILDSTGVVMSRSGRGRDRGQHEVDVGQYDTQTNLIAVSGAGPMYRKTALLDVAERNQAGGFEFFDEDFHSYWEDVDLSLRMINRGWQIQFVPTAVGYHGRTASSSPGGYRKLWSFWRHHRGISKQIRSLNYKNHIFLVLKNFPYFYWQFFVREILYNLYVLVFETGTLKILPQFFEQLSRMWRKRKIIQKNRMINQTDFQQLLVK